MTKAGRIGREFGVIGLITLSCCAAVHGTQSLGCEIEKIIASDADELDGFGEHLSVRGDVAIVGAWNDEDTIEPVDGFAFGSAYVLRRIDDAWTEEQKLLPSDPESEKRFGYDVAVDGDALIVGAVGVDGYTGAVYFYARVGGVWTNEQKIQPVSATFIDEVGFAVAIDGDVAIAGAPGDDEGCGPGCNSGAAYVFRNVDGTWVDEQKLIASDAAFQEQFGHAVAVRGDTVLVTSRTDDDAGISTGSVWVYRFQDGSWQEVQKLNASDAEVGDLFGHSVALGDGVLVVGALQDDDACPDDPLCNSGSAYVFRFNGSTWTEEAKLVASDGAEDDEFGNAVAVDGDYVVVGARWADDACPEDPDCNSGVAYVYHDQNGTWVDEGKLGASDMAATDYFGVDVAVIGDRALVGSYLDDDAGTASGSVYIYDLTGASCECPEDLDGNDTVDVFDLLQLLSAWGDCPDCPEDLDGNRTVDVFDLLALLAAWGPCS
jgi:hypothetical protein